MGETCETCRFWMNRGYRQVWFIGSSKSVADTVCAIRSVAGDFPPRMKDEWCGEHQPKTPPKGQEMMTR